MAITHFDDDEAVNEESDSEYACTFHDAGAGAEQLDSDAITAIAATLSDVKTGAIINARDEQDVLNANGGTLATDGAFTLRLDADDNAIQGTGTSPLFEQHRLTLEVTYNRTGGGIGHLNHEVRFFVKKLADVP